VEPADPAVIWSVQGQQPALTAAGLCGEL